MRWSKILWLSSAACVTWRKRAMNSGSRAVPRYLPTLDGWRAIAILLVLLAHGTDAWQTLLAGRSILFDLQPLKHVGLVGVQIFFGLSGFLITSNLLREERERGAFSVSSFYGRRAFRILPAALCFLLTVALLSAFGIIHVSESRWFSSLLFFANYSQAPGSWYVGHFWSLAVEEHFYLVWPALLLWVRSPKGRLSWGITLSLGVALWRAVDFKYHLTITGNFEQWWGHTDIQVDNILWGAVAAVLWSDERCRERLLRALTRGSVRWILIAALALSLTLSIGWKSAMLQLTLKAMMLPLLIIATSSGAWAAPARLLESALMRFVGRLSYSIYLWQQLFMVWDESRAPAFGRLQDAPWNLLMAIATALLSYYLVERPLLALGHKLLGGSRPVQPALATD